MKQLTSNNISIDIFAIFQIVRKRNNFGYFCKRSGNWDSLLLVALQFGFGVANDDIITQGHARREVMKAAPNQFPNDFEYKALVSSDNYVSKAFNLELIVGRLLPELPLL